MAESSTKRKEIQKTMIKVTELNGEGVHCLAVCEHYQKSEADVTLHAQSVHVHTLL